MCSHSIPVIRRTLRQLSETSSFDSAGQLLLDGGAHICAIVYFRAGYTPRDYPSDAEYDAIYRVERSVAVKCPSLAVHLAGAKKVQQVLADPAELSRFLAPDECAQLQQCFAGLYALHDDDEATLRVIAAAIVSPHKYVLKPQREGGGNNLWADEMVDALKRMNKQERAAFILMDKIDVRAVGTGTAAAAALGNEDRRADGWVAMRTASGRSAPASAATSALARHFQSLISPRRSSVCLRVCVRACAASSDSRRPASSRRSAGGGRHQ